MIEASDIDISRGVNKVSADDELEIYDGWRAQV